MMRLIVGDFDPSSENDLTVERLEAFPTLAVDDDSLPLVSAVTQAVRRAFGGKAPEQFSYGIQVIGLAVMGPPEGGRVTPEMVWSGSFYGVDENGLLTVGDDGLEEFSVGEFTRAVEAGYYSTDTPTLLVTPHHGGGGNGFIAVDLVDWLVHQVPGVLLGYGVGKVADRALGSPDRRLREAAEGWATRRIEYPHQLRAWIETKQEWSPTEVAQRLQLPEDSAAALLAELGFERTDRGGFVLRSSLSALRKRDVWIFHETTEFMTDMEDLGDHYTD